MQPIILSIPGGWENTGWQQEERDHHLGSIPDPGLVHVKLQVNPACPICREQSAVDIVPPVTRGLQHC